MAMATRGYQGFSQVAEVDQVIRPEHVVACVFQLALTAPIVRMVA